MIWPQNDTGQRIPSSEKIEAIKGRQTRKVATLAVDVAQGQPAHVEIHMARYKDLIPLTLNDTSHVVEHHIHADDGMVHLIDAVLLLNECSQAAAGTVCRSWTLNLGILHEDRNNLEDWFFFFVIRFAQCQLVSFHIVTCIISNRNMNDKDSGVTGRPTGILQGIPLTHSLTFKRYRWLRSAVAVPHRRHHRRLADLPERFGGRTKK